MIYTPPSHDAVNFSWEAATEYTPPLSDEVDFSFILYPDGIATGVGTSGGSAEAEGALRGVWTAAGLSIGVAVCIGSSRTNRSNGFAAGKGRAQFFGTFICEAVGTSTAIGVLDATSRRRPKDLFLGYEFDGTSITIPIASVIGLTTEEADAVTGDWREILQAVLLRAVEYHRSFVWSEQFRTYNAFGMNLFRTQTFDRHFSITFYTDMGEANVAPEP